MSLLLEGDARAGARPRAAPARRAREPARVLAVCSAWARERSASLVVVSGTGEPRADFARASTVPLDVVEAVRTYLTIGGERNVGECLKFLSDRLLLTGYGSAPPLDVPEHGVYLRDVEDATIEDWERAPGCREADRGGPVLSRAPAQRQHGVRRRAGRRARAAAA